MAVHRKCGCGSGVGGAVGRVQDAGVGGGGADSARHDVYHERGAGFGLAT